MNIQEIHNFGTFIFDSDGCLVEEGQALPGAIELLNLLLENGKRIVIYTNNSTSHPRDVSTKYHNLGLMVDKVVNSGLLAARYCQKQGINKVFYVGETGLENVLTESNISISSELDVDAVIVGMDRTLTYEKLALATRMIRSGSRFIATNPDKSFPTPRGLEPGAGSMIAALVAATDVSPEIILGKPEIWGYNLILEEYGILPQDAIMFGDRFETDILGARNAGIQGVLIGTGVSKSRGKTVELEKLKGEWYFNDLIEVLRIFSEK